MTTRDGFCLTSMAPGGPALHPAPIGALRKNPMRDDVWSGSEKKIARRVFDAALQRELAECKSRAARSTTPQDLWALERYLGKKRSAIDQKYDFRYSRLLEVFAVLLREKRIEERDLDGLSADKLDAIHMTVEFIEGSGS